jgi:synaptosomal-associated protein 25
MSFCLLIGFRQTKALGDSEKDYDELNFRIKGANTRARRLLGK